MRETTRQAFEVAICGGGIGGLCLAIGLHKHGVPFTVYEGASAIADVGAGMSFGRNSLRAMSLIDPAIEAAYRRHETLNAWESKRQNWFEFRRGHGSDDDDDDDELIFEFPERYMGQSSIHRARLMDALLALVPPERVVLGKRVERVVAEGDGGDGGDGGMPRIEFADGTAATADVVVGCDGVRSRIRPAVVGAGHPAAEPRFTGKYCYRRVVGMDRLRALVGDERAANSVLYLGARGHVVTYPIEHGTQANIVAFHSKDDGAWGAGDWVVPCTFERVAADFEGWSDTVLRIISLLDDSPSAWALFCHPETPTYHRGRVCLLGDAAHAGTPHQGAAGGQAIEDALVLSELLGRVAADAGSKDAGRLEGALGAYDAVRRPRAQRVVRTSNAAGVVYDFEDGELGSDCARIREDLRTRFDWIWEHDPRDDVDKALGLLLQ